ncbi:MAG TPA: carboxypeptidase-like regulatory domain-containing protein [Bacteroidales bacterium]|nr:carboxypeptidase-like regulatory domain-containing protein [Bacteroidales bacterium]
MRTRFNFLFIIILSFSGYSQNLFQTIRGTVVDKETKSPLPGANVILVNSLPIKGTTTDISGKFRLENVAVGRQSLKVTFLGYDEFLFNNIEVISAHELVLTIELSEKIYTSKEVVISAKNEKQNNINEMSVISTRQFSVEETNQYAGAWGDVSRMASNFAGVSVASDERNDIVVRGNSPMGILWRLDGVEMPNPNHFADVGSSGGGISMINNNLLDNSDFLSGAFAPEYGNATSAVFDLKLRNGNNEKREYIAQIGARGVELGAEGPFVKGKQASYLAFYNYSTVALLSLMGIKIIDAVPNFQDLSFKLNFPLKKGYISLFGVGGISKSVFKPAKDSATWKNDGDRLGDVSGSRSAIGAFTWFYPVGKNSYFKTIVSSSYFNPDYSEDSTGNDYKIYQLNRKSTAQQNNIFSVLFNSKINVKNIIRAGIIFKNQNFRDNTYYYTYDGGQNKHIVNDNKGNINLLQAYLQYKCNISEKFSLTPGFHALYLLNNGRLSFEPRIAFRWAINNIHSLTLGFGLHGQVQPSQIYYSEVISGNETIYPNVSLNFTKSYQAVLCYDWLFTEFWRSKIEIYYQDLRQIPVSPDEPILSLVNFSNSDNAFANKILVNKGKGQNFGMELTIEKFLSKGYYILFTASVYDSKYFDANGVKRNTRFNSNYAFNLLGGKEFKIGRKKNSTIGFSIKIVEIGGQRYTPIDLAQSIILHQAVYIDSLTYTKKTTDFFKIDFRMRYRLNAKKCSHEFAFELGNILNRKNVAGFRYNPYTNEIDYIHDLPLIPLASYRIEF